MTRPDVLVDQIPDEALRERFLHSSWPRIFHGVAQAASQEGAAIGDNSNFQTLEGATLLIAEEEERKLLEDLQAVEASNRHRASDTLKHPETLPGYTSPEHVAFNAFSVNYGLRFTEVGKNLIAACADLFTAEERIQAELQASSELTDVLAEIDATLGNK